MRKAGIRVLTWDEMDADARKFANDYYQREVDPLLTPITIDPAHPFPRVLNKAMCLALLLRRKRRGIAGPCSVWSPFRVPCRASCVSLAANGAEDYIFLHDLIERNAAGMYRGYEILSPRRLSRHPQQQSLFAGRRIAFSCWKRVRAELHNRRKGDAVRLEIDSTGRSRNRRPPAHQFRARRIAGLSHRRSGQSLPRDDSLQLLGARRAEIQTLRASRAAPQSQIRPTCSTRFATATSCCTIPTTPTTASSPSSKPRPRIPTSSR